MYSLKIVKDAKNLIDINLLTKIQHFNDVRQSTILPLLVATYIFLFVTNMVQFFPSNFTQKPRLGKQKNYVFTKISKFSRCKFDNITPKLA